MFFRRAELYIFSLLQNDCESRKHTFRKLNEYVLKYIEGTQSFGGLPPKQDERLCSGIGLVPRGSCDIRSILHLA